MVCYQPTLPTYPPRTLPSWIIKANPSCLVSFISGLTIVSTQKHVKNILMSRFRGFLAQIEKSHKSLPRSLLQVVKNDTRSKTGSNHRNILLLTDKYFVEDLKMRDVAKIEYAPVKEDDEWKVNLVKEILDVKVGEAKVEEFSKKNSKKS